MDGHVIKQKELMDGMLLSRDEMAGDHEPQS